jgi:hypothetical protein
MKQYAQGGLATMADNPENAEEWEKIKNYVGGANKQAKHPLQQEAERKQMKTPHYDAGVGGMGVGSPDDPNAGTGLDPESLKMLEPAGAGVIAPSIGGSTAPLPPPVAPQAPVTPPSTPQTPTAPPVASPAPTDATYNKQATDVLGGITPDAIQRLAQALQTTPGQKVGLGLSGIGDAIASVGGREPGHMKSLEENLQKNRELQMKVPEAMAQAGKEKFTLAQQLQAKDPNSPYSKVIQKSVTATLKPLGWTDAQIATLPADAAQDAAKNGLTYADTQAKYKLAQTEHEQTIGLERAQLENTKNYQQGQQQIERDNQKLAHPIASRLSGVGNPSAPSSSTTGPLGATTVKNGVTYEWSPITGKYHPMDKQQ